MTTLFLILWGTEYDLNLIKKSLYVNINQVFMKKKNNGSYKNNYIYETHLRFVFY